MLSRRADTDSGVSCAVFNRFTYSISQSRRFRSLCQENGAVLLSSSPVAKYTFNGYLPYSLITEVVITLFFVMFGR